MVSITLSIPEDVKKEMEKFQEINWSGFVRTMIIKRARELAWKEEMLKKLDGEKELDEWAVKISRESKKERIKELKKRGLLDEISP
ncbi:MAG: hypothetical protein AABX11_05405 [Nanoarchaeota archaeon]